MTDVTEAKRALARLASPDCIRRARLAVDTLETAARFRQSGGVERLRRAVAAAGGRREARGRAALREFQAYAAAARGEQFHRGHDTSLGGGAERGDDDTGDPHG